MEILRELLHENKKGGKSNPQDIRYAIQQGQLDKEMGLKISDSIRRKIRSEIKNESDWRINTHHADIGVIYTGDDPQYAEAMVTKFIDVILTYFQNVPRDQMVRVDKQEDDKHTAGPRIVYTVVPEKGEPQIRFFRKKEIIPQEPALGVLIL